MENQQLAVLQAALAAGESPLSLEQSQWESRLGLELFDRVVCSQDEREADVRS